ncbi:MAG: T9SS type A sorting domain-containing protein [bacterium]|nr:MAG: T9SS type A sorting domain-containing protein [bacterium]
MRKHIVPMLLAAAMALYSADAAAQYDVRHGVFSNGSGRRSGSNYSYDTAGQGAIGISSGGSYVVKSGFWYSAAISSTVDVAITSFESSILGDAVVLKWRVTATAPFIGFNIYRSEGDEQHFQKINEELILPDAGNEYRDEDVFPGRTYNYQIGAVDESGESFSYILTLSLPPKALTLYQNYPNPFNPSTTISFYLPQAQRVVLTIYDVQGRRVKTLVDGTKEEGTNKVIWNGTNDRGSAVGSGVYYYRLVAGKKVITKKLVVLR